MSTVWQITVCKIVFIAGVWKRWTCV